MGTIEEEALNNGEIGGDYEQAEKIQQEQVANDFRLGFGWIHTPTGEGSIEEYVDHPLNFNRSKGLAQILRGVTGFLGNLKLAVVDIFVGVMNYWKENKKNVAVKADTPSDT